MTSSKAAQTLLKEGIALAKAGDKPAARQRLQEALSLDPANEAIWLYLSGLAENATEAKQALAQVQRLNPENPFLPAAQTWANKTWPSDEVDEPKSNAHPQPISTKVKLWATVAAVGLILLLGVVNIGLVKGLKKSPSLAAAIIATSTQTTDRQIADLWQLATQAKAAADKPAMVKALEQLRTLAPDNQKTAAQLAQLYYEQGLTYRNNGDVPAAKTAFKQAVAVQPQFQAAATEIKLAELYLSGAKYHQNADWLNAIPPFEEIYEQNPTYPNAAEILYSAYFNLGIQQQALGELEQALASYQKSESLLPHAPEATEKIAQITNLLNPAPPAEPEPQAVVQKRVVVDITDQWAYVYEGDTLVKDFVVSTGEPGRDTATGDFEILDKIPMAYASTWNLDMPFWLGIYWSGPLENGFHAVPTVRDTGVTMWEGYLGQRVSYGCIVLSMDDAEWLFDWVDVGTPVSITL